MAEDLIPPRSPAGRPKADGGRVEDPAPPPLEAGTPWAEVAEETQAAVAIDADEPQQPLPESPYRSRFGLITGALIGVGLSAAEIQLVAIASSGGSHSNATSASWKPTQSPPYRHPPE